MDIRKLQRTIVDGLEDVKAQNIVVFNTEHLSPLFERVIIASGTSNRQTRSLASSVREAVKGAGLPVPRMEGESNGEWIIVDCGAAVVHVMQPPIREYYHLEELWGDKPVRMKLGSATPQLVKAAEPAEGERPAARARPKAIAQPPASKQTRAAAKRAKAADAAPAAKRSAPRQRAAPAPRAGVTRTVGVKTPTPRGPALERAASARGAAAPRPAKRAAVKSAAPRARKITGPA